MLAEILLGDAASEVESEVPATCAASILLASVCSTEAGAVSWVPHSSISEEAVEGAAITAAAAIVSARPTKSASDLNCIDEARGAELEVEGKQLVEQSEGSSIDHPQGEGWDQDSSTSLFISFPLSARSIILAASVGEEVVDERPGMPRDH